MHSASFAKSQILIESHINSEGQEMHHLLTFGGLARGWCRKQISLVKVDVVSRTGSGEENRCSVFSVSTLHTHRSIMTRDSLKHVEIKVELFKSPLWANPLMSSVCIPSLHRSIVTQDLVSEVRVSACSVEASTLVGDSSVLRQVKVKVLCECSEG